LSTEDEKARNRAKQARFQERHPGYRHKGDAKRQIKPTLFRDAAGKYRMFELADPRDLDELPRIIGYCKCNIDPVWANFWLAKDHSKACWASWLRELASLGLQPVELKKMVLGSVVGISKELARNLTVLRVRQMNEITTGNPLFPPPWSFRNLMTYKCQRIQQRVACLSTGRAIYFANSDEARRMTGISNVSEFIRRVDFDSQGRLWFEDQ